MTPLVQATEAIVTRQTAAVSTHVSPGPTATDNSREISLKLWVEPEFGPGLESPGGLELESQLLLFQQANPGVEVELRVKSAAGPGGILDAVRAAAAAAPGTLPDVIAVNFRILRLAAEDGFVVELDDVISPEVLEDIYDFALQNSSWRGSLVGLPFASDALVAVYSTKAYESPPMTWNDVLESQNGPMIFPAADHQSLTALQQYLALGGSIDGQEDEIVVTLDPLARLFDYYVDARRLGILTQQTLDYSTGAETWAAYRGLGAQLAVTSAHSYLLEHNMVEDTQAVLIPTEDGSRLALAESWSYALVNSSSGRQAYAAMLVDWLTQPENLGAWSLKAGYLPPRASALDHWSNEALGDFARDVLVSSTSKPDASTLAVVGTPFSEAIASVIRGQAAPPAAAAAVVQDIAARHE